MTRARVALCTFVSFVSFVSFPPFVSFVFAQPDPRAMSGIPLPVSDLAPGTVTARVIRGQLSNPVEGVSVELTGTGDVKTATTDGSGRATFTGIAPGTRVKTRVTLDGATIESQEFVVPPAGGVRVMLVGTDGSAPNAPPGAAPTQQPAVSGSVVFGPETRFVIEMGDDQLNVFNMLQIANPQSRPVDTGGPLVFDLPEQAVGLGMMEGSTPNATAAARKVTVNGPFPPGNTVVQFGYSMPLGADTIAIDERLPIELPQLAVIVQKTGAMQLASPQVAQRREMSADGNTYIVAQGGAIPAGGVLSLSLSGLPSRPAWPRNVALAGAVLILAAGAYAAWRRPARVVPATQALRGRRERLFAELTALEAQQRKGAIDAAAYAARRETLVTALEDLYRGLDREVA
jgi:hypothetical protein